MSRMTNELTKKARAQLSQKQERDWTEHDYELDSALREHAENPPTDRAGMDAAHEHLYDLFRRAY